MGNLLGAGTTLERWGSRSFINETGIYDKNLDLHFGTPNLTYSEAKQCTLYHCTEKFW